MDLRIQNIRGNNYHTVTKHQQHEKDFREHLIAWGHLENRSVTGRLPERNRLAPHSEHAFSFVKQIYRRLEIDLD